MSNKTNDGILEGLEDGTISMKSEQAELLNTLDGAGKNPDAVRLGRLGGLKRAQTLSKARIYEIAQNAGKKRWGKDRPNVKFTPPSEPASQ